MIAIRCLSRLAWAMSLLVLLVPALGASASPAVCGPWTIVSAPGASTATAYLEGIGGSGNNDVWVVGHHADYSDVQWQPLIRHWNGRSWTAVAAPPGRGRFYAVAAISRTDAWAVGEGPIIAHWNGKTWSLVPSPRVTNDPREPARLLDIAALSPTNVWAVGLNWHYPTLQLIEHWNGRRWRVIPGVPAGKHPLSAMAALSPTDIWAVGTGLAHWNGSRWTLASAAVSGSAIAALGDSNIWVAGDNTIQHWNGSAWSTVRTPSTGEQYITLTHITAVGPGDIWASGYTGHIVPHDGYAEHGLIEHWNGTAWSIVPTPATGSPDSQLLDIAATPDGTVWAVGFAGKHRAVSTHPLIERYTRC